MKVSAQEIEQRQMVLEIEVEEERMQRALDQAYKRIVNRIKVPGFRPGRAPRPLVERMVGRETLLEDAVEHLVPQVYEDALKEQKISPAGQPRLEVTSTEPLQFKATVPLEPEVHLGDYHSIDLKPEPVMVQDAEVEAVIERLRDSHASWVPVERAVQLGDRVGLDVNARRDGTSLFDQHDAEFVVNPDGPEPAPGFSQQLVGLTAEQDRQFTLGGGEQPAGEEARESSPQIDFSVRVKWVKEKQLPDLDDDFARTVGDKETVAQLREDIVDQIHKQKEQETRERYREALVQAAVDQAQIQVPPQLVDRQARQILESMASRLDRQKISLEQYLQFTGQDEETFKSDIQAQADRTLKRSLVLEAIADAESVEVSEAEVREQVQLAARTASDPDRAARQALERPESSAYVQSVLRTNKALERLVEIAGGAPAEVAASEPAEASETNGETHG